MSLWRNFRSLGFRPVKDSHPPIEVCVLGHDSRGSNHLAAALSDQPEFNVVYAWEPQADLPAEMSKPGSVVVYDAGVVDRGAFETVVALHARAPQASVLVVAEHGHREFITTVLRAGARGCVLRSQDSSPSLESAVRSLAARQGYLCPQAAKIVLEDCMWVRNRTRALLGDAATGKEDLLKPLTQREREVLRLVAEGHTTPMIAGLLSISAKTVEGHRGRLMAKLRVSNVAGLVRSAIRAGMIAA